MSDPSTEEIAAELNSEQRAIVLATPENWREADALPDGLFDYDETYDSDTAEERCFWSPTELGKQVRALVEAEKG